ncbi:AAA family ATPase [Ideonella sp.]|uniref:ATP-binding protein n=1 Tax=Ideonella sp. TaxID=1929293 RepID=UPI0035B0F6D3
MNAELPTDDGTRSHEAAPRVRLLGLPRLQWPDGRQHLLQRRDAALLALLALEGAMPRSRAATRIWPDADAEGARNNLRQRLFRLRRTAERDVVHAGDVLSLADGIEHDLQAPAQHLGDDPQGMGGELLGTLDYSDCAELAEWVGAARERWRGTRAQALASIATRLEESREIERALAYAHRLLEDDPLQEPAHRRVMRLHYLRGDRAAALAAYARLVKLLALELRAEPEHETRTLAGLIEQGGALPHAAARPLPPAVLRPPRLIGRERELQALEAAWHDGAAVVVLGEAGIGKSRLLGDFAATRGLHVAVGARASDAPVPYALLARLLRALPAPQALADWARSELARLLPEWGAPPPGRLDPLHLRAATAALLADAVAQASGAAASPTPLCIVIDDLHFADAATLEALPALLGEAQGVRWLLGSRPQAEGPPALANCLAALEALEALDQPALQPFELSPLDAAAVHAFVASLELPGIDPQVWAPALWKRSGGNPLFLLETLRALLRDDHAASPDELPTPAPLARLIERRLDRLRPPALRLARLAALAGGDFDIELAAAVLGLHVLDLADPWRELQDAHIVRDDAFAHDLVLEATRAAVPDTVARSLHGQIAAQLAARGVSSARVASHWQAAQHWREAALAHEAAAREALAASRRTDELAHRRRAVEAWLEAGAPDEAFRARAESLEALLLVEDVEQARAWADELLADARNATQRLEAQLARAQTLLMAVRPDEALAAATEARTLAATAADTCRERRAARYVAVALAQAQRSDEAVNLLEPYRDGLPDDPADDETYGFWSDFSYVLHTARRLSRSVEALERAIAGSQARGDLSETFSTLSNLAGVKGNLGRLDDALRDAERAQRLGERLGDVGGVPAGSVEIHLGLLQAAGGHLGQALGHFDAALAMFARAGQGTWVTIAGNHRANLLLQLGQTARAQQALPADDEAVHRPTRSRRLVIAARIASALQHDPQPLLAEALAMLGQAGDPYGRLLAAIDGLPHEAPAQAAAHAADLEAQAEHIEYLAVAAKARWYRIDALRRGGLLAEAAALAHDALGALAGIKPWDMYLPEAWWIAQRVFAGLGDTSAANQVLRTAHAWIDAATQEVPPAFRDSFLQRNPINRTLLTTPVTRG